MDHTPPLPIAEELRPHLNTTTELSPTQAHQVLLYCALDGACVPMDTHAATAITRLAELDYPTVRAVIDWIKTATRRAN